MPVTEYGLFAAKYHLGLFFILVNIARSVSIYAQIFKTFGVSSLLVAFISNIEKTLLQRCNILVGYNGPNINRDLLYFLQ